MKNEEESTSEFSSFNSQFICYICILFKRIWKNGNWYYHWNRAAKMRLLLCINNTGNRSIISVASIWPVPMLPKKLYRKSLSKYGKRVNFFVRTTILKACCLLLPGIWSLTGIAKMWMKISTKSRSLPHWKNRMMWKKKLMLIISKNI